MDWALITQAITGIIAGFRIGGERGRPKLGLTLEIAPAQQPEPRP